MAELIKQEVVQLPALVAVGKEIRVTMGEVRGDNPIPAFWDKCFKDGVFAELEQTPSWSTDCVGFETGYDDPAEPWTYVVGMLKEPGADVPNGCSAYPIAPTEALVVWVRGKTVGEIAGAAHDMAVRLAAENGWRVGNWCMEYYNCPRFTTPDENGLITLDFYLPITR